MRQEELQNMPAEERENFHRAAESQVSLFRFDTPEPTGRPKQVTWLVKRPLFHLLMQTVHDGGENNLHYHLRSETSWMVLKGRAQFFGIDGALLADLKEMEGIHIPGGTRYRFLKAGDGDLEILQMVAAEDPESGSDRINLEAHREWMTGDTNLTKY